MSAPRTPVSRPTRRGVLALLAAIPALLGRAKGGAAHGEADAPARDATTRRHRFRGWLGH